VAHPSENPAKGLARERTVLAWNRSGLAAVVCIAVLIRHLAPIRSTGQEVALALIGVAAILWAVALLTFTLSGAGRNPEALVGPRIFLLMTVATLILALVGFLLAVFAQP
jgi:uncharacterized membrane protein YidH (DUF202 family)